MFLVEEKINKIRKKSHEQMKKITCESKNLKK